MKYREKIFLLILISGIFSFLIYFLVKRRNIFENLNMNSTTRIPSFHNIRKKKSEITFNVPILKNIIHNNHFDLVNQNFDAPWMEKQKSYNFPIVQDYGNSYTNFYKFNQYIFNDFTNNQMKDFTTNASNYFNTKVIKDKYKLQETLSKNELYKINQKSWSFDFKWDPNKTLYRDYSKSTYNEINIMNHNLLSHINTFLYSAMRKNPMKKIYIYKPYFVYRYRIVQIFEDDSKKVRLYEVVVNILRDNSYIGFNFLLSGIFIRENNKYNLSKLKIEYISNNALASELIRPNLDKYNNYFSVDPEYKK